MLLVVEDDRHVLAALQRYLSPYVDVIAVGTVEAALRHIDHVDALLVDQMLPDGCGLSLVTTARERHRMIPMMVFSAYDDAAISNRAFQLGAAFCAKPIDTETLQRFVVEVNAPGTLKITRAIESWTARYKLTPAEARVVCLAAESGETQDQIAQICGVTRETTKTHVKSLLAKTGDRSLTQTALRLLREAGF